ncbi:Shikimate kinase [Acidimicrobium ferrooxidans DSM 10331]|uniref:Shikimate kinase n=1 Tax=Acidimicrobium ferrooxidans (strain DSM 10331 / JCM 15462 / NBRC 103882 / ICP) TaxID=525909 RepID=C7M296_ACIFD|nr:shikimate kinase [Acidimicrobium ferrooxidans]ACU53194.1 Shikimate kinase [Acidimicrobium ferrooxidans DSM 10331]
MSDASERVVLIGFMGAGKTTVGRLLARRLGADFVDADDALVAETGRSIPDLFRVRGEVGFRQLEGDLLGRLLRSARGVIALGGGAIEHDELAELVAPWLVIYLEVPYDVARQRVGSDDGRPMLTRSDLESVYRRRVARYRRLADLTVDATDAPSVIVDEIVSAFGALGDG